MNTSRRAFFAKIVAATVGLAVDPELLAWEPGKISTFDLGGLQTFTAFKGRGISVRMMKGYDAIPIGTLHEQYLAGRIGTATGFDWFMTADEINREIGGKVLDLVPIIYAGRSGLAISKLAAASEGFVLTETMPRAEFERRWREV